MQGMRTNPRTWDTTIDYSALLVWSLAVGSLVPGSRPGVSEGEKGGRAGSDRVTNSPPLASLVSAQLYHTVVGKVIGGEQKTLLNPLSLAIGSVAVRGAEQDESWGDPFCRACLYFLSSVIRSS